MSDGLVAVFNWTGAVLTALCLLDVLRHLLPLKRRYVLLALFGLIQIWMGTVPVYVGDPVNVVVFLVLLALWVALCFRGPAWAKAAVVLIVCPLVTGVNAIFVNYIPIDFPFIFLGLIWLVFALSVRRFMPVGGLALSGRLWILLSVLAVTPFMAVFLIILLGDVPYVGVGSLASLAIFPFAAVSAAALLAAIVVLSRHEQLERAQALWQARSQYYQSVEERQVEIRRMRHDMANHLAVLSALEPEAARDYIQELTGTPALGEGMRLTANDTVNAVLVGKSAQMEELGIDSVLEAELPARLTVSDVDLCALFANSLDNAIEACRALPVEKRLIRLRAGIVKGQLILRVENAMAGELDIRDGVIRTTKADRQNHGLGLAGMREIAGRYGGHMDVTQQDELFKLVISLPV